MKARLTAVITGRAREVGPIEAHERTVLAAARKVEQLARRKRELTAELKRTATSLRLAKREFRLLLQRHPDATLEQLELAGKADGADRAIALADRPRIVHNHAAGEPCNALSCPVARHTSAPAAVPIEEEWPTSDAGPLDEVGR